MMGDHGVVVADRQQGRFELALQRGDVDRGAQVPGEAGLDLVGRGAGQAQRGGGGFVGQGRGRHVGRRPEELRGSRLRDGERRGSDRQGGKGLARAKTERH